MMTGVVVKVNVLDGLESFTNKLFVCLYLILCFGSAGEDLSVSSLEKDSSSSASTPATTPSEEWNFNSFQYWRVPIPEIPLVDVDLAENEFRKLSVECSSSKRDLNGSESNSELQDSGMLLILITSVLYAISF